MKTGPIFSVPDRIYVDDRLLSIGELRVAIEDNDMEILEPLIDQITREAAAKKQDSLTFAFLVVVIRPIIKEARIFDLSRRGRFCGFLLRCVGCYLDKTSFLRSNKVKIEHICLSSDSRWK